MTLAHFAEAAHWTTLESVNYPANYQTETGWNENNREIRSFLEADSKWQAGLWEGTDQNATMLVLIELVWNPIFKTWRQFCFFKNEPTRDKQNETFGRDLNPTQIRLVLSEKVATVKKTKRAIVFLFRELVTLGTDTSEQTHILLLGSSQSPSPMAVDVPFYISAETESYVRVTEVGRRASMAAK